MPTPAELGGGSFPFVGPFPAPGSASWLQAITTGLHMFFMNQGPFGGALTASEQQQLQNILSRESQANPQGFLGAFGTVAQQYGYTTGNSANDSYLQNLGNGLVDVLTGAASGAARNIVNNITENSTKTTTQTGTQTETATGGTTTQTNIRDTTFVEIPTPEEFLDNFQTGLATQGRALLDSGAIDKHTFDFMMDNPGSFLDPYLGELGRRAAAGEQIFKVVGLENAATLLGERFGGAQHKEGTTVNTENRITDQELTQLVNETINRLTASMADTTPQSVTDTITSVVNSVFKSHQDTTTREEFKNIADTVTTEQIFGRPKLTTVASLSPLDFLQQHFPAMTLQNFAAQEAGRPSAAQVRQEVLPSATRRLA